MFRHACAMGLEGIVSKRATSRYKRGRCLSWVKVKNPAATPFSSRGARMQLKIEKPLQERPMLELGEGEEPGLRSPPTEAPVPGQPDGRLIACSSGSYWLSAATPSPYRSAV